MSIFGALESVPCGEVIAMVSFIRGVLSKMLHCIYFREVRGQISEALQIIVMKSTLQYMHSVWCKPTWTRLHQRLQTGLRVQATLVFTTPE